MIDEYEVAHITTPLNPKGDYRLLIAYEQAGYHYRRCSACDGFHLVGYDPGRRSYPHLSPNRLALIVDNPRALRGRVPAERCEYLDARRDPRQSVQRHYAERVARGEEAAPSGWEEIPA